MCDTAVVVGPTGVLFGKNSDREPLEAQGVECVDARGSVATSRCTHLEVPGTAARAVVLSRPVWMWGAEMGANADGVVAGNEAVFTRLPVEKTGLTGMDLLRLALERGTTAEEAVEVVVELLGRFPQGGRCGFANASFRYHSSFVFADARSAFVLETAGPYWAVEKVSGVRTLSNVLTIGVPDRVHPEAADVARARGWLKRGQELNFARAFGDPLYRALSGGEGRRACTAQSLSQARATGLEGVRTMAAALRSHGGLTPAHGLRMKMPCAHASWSPARAAGQTTASMVSLLEPGRARHFFTGTSAPCVSVFKPVAVGGRTPTPLPAERADASLFWRHEQLHRVVVQGYEERRATFEAERLALEARALDGDSGAWDEHRAALQGWIERAAAAPASGPWGFRAYWKRIERAAG